MAHHGRQRSIAGIGPPHALSLKVLRLSRPSLAIQTPLPPTHFGDGSLDIPPAASLAHPRSSDLDNHDDAKQSGAPGEVTPALSSSGFPLTPLLTLPPAFGAAYVGEPFACTLCVNNETLEEEGKRVHGVRIVAELQTPGTQPGQGVTIELSGEDGKVVVGRDEEEEGEDELACGATLQRTLRHDLKDEGPHQLAVTVTYTETMLGEEGAGAAEGGRARTFRKLYQFVAQSLMAVRSKITERKGRVGEGGGRQWLLEAQLENMGEGSVVLERTWLTGKDGISSKGLNERESDDAAIVLKPQDVEQVAFLICGRQDAPDAEEKVGDAEVPRTALAQLHVDWRAAMGEGGSLTTNWLAPRSR